MKKSRNSNRIDPHIVAHHGSYEHLYVFIQDLIDIIKQQDKLAQEVMTLNPDYLEIGEGKLRNLQELAGEIIWR